MTVCFSSTRQKGNHIDLNLYYKTSYSVPRCLLWFILNDSARACRGFSGRLLPDS